MIRSMLNVYICVFYRDISYTNVHSLPETMLKTMKILVATSVYSLRTLPRLDLFAELVEANLTYPSHCCAFANYRKLNRSFILSLNYILFNSIQIEFRILYIIFKKYSKRMCFSVNSKITVN